MHQTRSVLISPLSRRIGTSHRNMALRLASNRVGLRPSHFTFSYLLLNVSSNACLLYSRAFPVSDSSQTQQQARLVSRPPGRMGRSRAPASPALHHRLRRTFI